MKKGIHLQINSPNVQQKQFLSLSQNFLDQNERQSDIISQISILPELMNKNSADIQQLQSDEKEKEQLKIQNIQQILLAKSFTEKDQDSGIESLVDGNENYQKLNQQKSKLPIIQEQRNSKPIISSRSNSKDDDSSNKGENKSSQSIKNNLKISLSSESVVKKFSKTNTIKDIIRKKIDTSIDNYQNDYQQVEVTATSPHKTEILGGNIQETSSKPSSLTSIIKSSRLRNKFFAQEVNIEQDEKSAQNNHMVKQNTKTIDQINSFAQRKSKTLIYNKEDDKNKNFKRKKNKIKTQIQLSKITTLSGVISEDTNNYNQNFNIKKTISFKEDESKPQSLNQIDMSQEIKEQEFKFMSKQSSNTKKLSYQSQKSQKGGINYVKSINYQNLLFNKQQNTVDIEDMLPWYIISPFTKFKSIWNILLLFIMFFNALLVPIRLAFRYDIQIDFTVIDIIIDTLFILEFLQSFFSSYEDDEGKVVKSLKEIVSNYIKGWFWIDFVSSIMVFLMKSNEDQNIMRLFRIPKMYKQVKHTKLIHFLNNGPILRFMLFLKINTHYMDILRFSTIILFLIHIAGSIWYYLATKSPDINWFNTFYNTNQLSISIKYISSVYYVLSVLTTVGYGNIVSANTGEYIFTILFMLTAVVIYSWILGVLTYSFFKINEKSTILKNRFIYFNQIIAKYKLNSLIQEKLLKTVQMSFLSKSNRKLDIFQNNPIINDLPDEVVSKICEEIFHRIIKKITFLNDKPPNFISNLIRCVKSFHMNPGDLLYKKGDAPKDVYFLVEGRVVTKIQSSFLNFKTLVYVEGSFFGEVDLIFKRERKQNAFAETKCEIWRLTKKDFFRLMNYNEEIKAEIVSLAIKREEMLMKEEMKLLRAKIKDNPSLNSIVFDMPIAQKSRVMDLNSQIITSQQSIGDMINDEIAIQSKKKAYNSTFTKELSLTDIIKLSTRRLITSDDDLKDVSLKQNLQHVTQNQIKGWALEKMIENINLKDKLSLKKYQIIELSQTKKIITQVQRACGLQVNHHIKRDQELEDVIKKSVKIIRLNTK